MLPTTIEIPLPSILLALLGAFFLGISKAGIKGTSIIIVTLMALAFGAKKSTGLLVPLLVVGDVFAVVYYNRHAQWRYIWRFLPWMLLGLLIGVVVGLDLPERLFKYCMVTIILASLAMMVWWERKEGEKVPKHWLFGGFMGTLAGITTMIGNLAGAFSNVYFLAMRLPKNAFIGTAAWLFLIINVLKLPFHIWAWETITPRTLWINLWLLPALLLGLFSGVRLVSRIKNDFYRKMILALTAIGAVLILFK